MQQLLSHALLSNIVLQWNVRLLQKKSTRKIRSQNLKWQKLLYKSAIHWKAKRYLQLSTIVDFALIIGKPVWGRLQFTTTTFKANTGPKKVLITRNSLYLTRSETWLLEWSRWGHLYYRRGFWRCKNKMPITVPKRFKRERVLVLFVIIMASKTLLKHI